MHPSTRAWVEATAGGRVVEARRRYGGGSRELWFVDVEDDRHSRRQLVVRMENGQGGLDGTELSLSREARIYRALAGSRVPLPELMGCSPDGSTMLLERLAGTSSLASLDEAEARSVLESFFDAVGQLHALDPAALDVGTAPWDTDAGAVGRREVDRWARLATMAGPAIDPLIRYALSWLHEHPPREIGRVALLQGDTGPGNFVHDGGHVTGLVDWEFWHIGDPMDDVAWIDFRAAGGDGPFGETARRDSLYRTSSGLELDPDAIDYYAAMVRLRCVITTSVTLARGGGALGRAAYQAPHHRFLLELGSALAVAAGRDPVEVGPPSATLPPATPELTGADPASRLAARAVSLDTEHRRMVDLLGRDLAHEDESDRVGTLGGSSSVAEVGAVAERAGLDGDLAVLAYLTRRAGRSLALWATPAAGGWPAPPRFPRRG